MEVLTPLFRAIDSFFMMITIGIGTLLGALHIDFPLFSAYVVAEPSEIAREVSATTASTHATTTVVTAPTHTTSTTKTATPLPVTTTPTPSQPKTKVAVSYETINANVRAALVNILCIAQSGSRVGSISGSGIIIDSRGVILTNAHIGQMFLLKDYPSPNSIECTVRTGSPAEPKYHAELLYLPPLWIQENASQLKAEKPMGTGEHDYAFLRITAPTNPGSSLPTAFPAVPIVVEDPLIGEEVLLAAYPAGFLDGTSIERDLYITSAFTVVQKLFTFDEQGFIDVVSIGGTIVSQGGSSGGAMVRGTDGKLFGIIVTATAGATTGDRDLRALMTTHINRSLTRQGRGSIATLLAGDPMQTAANFAATIAPSERQKLIDALK